MLFALSFSLLLLTGCDTNVGLKGKVIFSDDRSPVPTGIVCFEMDNFLARGIINPDGTFVVGSLKAKDGLPKGTYRVYVSGAKKVIEPEKGGLEILEPLIDEKFTSGITSGIAIDVTPSTKFFEVVVDRYQPKVLRKR